MVAFTIPGKPVGYYTAGKRPNWTRQRAYHEYKLHVQRCAMAAGLRLPLTASREAPVLINTVAYFESGVHCDPENVRKGVADALFYAGKGQRKGAADKYTGGSFPPPRYDAEAPRVEVEVIMSLV